MKIKKPCLAPWHALTIKSNGDVVPDATFSGKLGNINDSCFSEIWSSPMARDLREFHRKKKLPHSCERCQQKHLAVGRSRRTFFEDHIRRHIPKKEIQKENTPNIIYLEVNFSNKCNLKCRMCSGHVSTAWIQDELSLQKKVTSYHRGYKPGYRKIEPQAIQNLLQDKEAFRNLKYVALRGGEPLIEELNFLLLDYLVETGLSNNIRLDISTNGTKYSEKLTSYADKFESIELYISLEGTDKVYEYIRGGKDFSFQQLEDNVRKYQKIENLTIVFAVTLMTYNIFNINNIWRWYLTIKKPGDEISFSNTVVNPNYLDFHVLPKNMREKALSKINNIDYPDYNYFSGKRWIGDIGISSLKKNLLKPEDTQSQRKLQQFIEFTRDLDELRGQNITETIPELESLFRQ